MLLTYTSIPPEYLPFSLVFVRTTEKLLKPSKSKLSVFLAHVSVKPIILNCLI